MDQRSLPLGYSFLGNEPDPTVCCDLRDCQRQQAVDYKRLNCGHSFHTECLRDTCSDLGQSASNADRARLCPICHPLLEDRIRDLSTTMNRLVKKKILKDIKAKHKLSVGSVFTIRSHKFIFRPLFLGIWRAMSSTVTTIATRKVTMKMMTMTPITSKTRVKAINKTAKSIPWSRSCTSVRGPWNKMASPLTCYPDTYIQGKSL